MSTKTTTKKSTNTKLSIAISKGKRLKQIELDNAIASAVAKDPY